VTPEQRTTESPWILNDLDGPEEERSAMNRYFEAPGSRLRQRRLDPRLPLQSAATPVTPTERPSGRLRAAAEKQSCLQTARPFAFRADLPNERRRDEIR
jgi:hypothetical protein